MRNFAYFGTKLQHLCNFSLTNFCRSFQVVTTTLYRVLAFHVGPFKIQLSYFIILSLFGFLGLKFSNQRSPVKPDDLDLFLTSVSASTVSSMTAVEMEVFSDSQLIFMAFLMLLGGDVFTCMLGLLFARFNFTQKQCVKNAVNTLALKQGPSNANHIELGLLTLSESVNQEQNNVQNGRLVFSNERLNTNSIRYLGYVVLSYLMVVHLNGYTLVSLYRSLTPSAREEFQENGLKLRTFSFFTIVSSFSSCGFVPTNENMLVFKGHSGLLLLIIPYILLGKTLYPPCLRLLIWMLEKLTRREEFSFMLKNHKKMSYDHIFSLLHCWLLVATVLGFNLIQIVLFCSMEWNSENMEGLNGYQKFIASLFLITNSRHAGESAFDLSSTSPAILVLFTFMMYLPLYTTFLPIERDRDPKNNSKKERTSVGECVLLCQLSYVVIFIVLICITERNSLRDDPLNFNVLNITLEVMSAYGDVGFSTGYSCKRQILKRQGFCKDSWVGFSGRWSSQGKFILVVVMFFGRLKKFSMRGGEAWQLS